MTEVEFSTAGGASPPPPPTGQMGLPAGWSAHSDPASGRTYFVNKVTGETSWLHPGGAV
eukprot:CAMPEP_0174755754 /NCGR_PEP_ID=MMETSP1094-20130205/106411_1 /TAXON_ID=156173 /ORGANISM="Chrysochromulina brevifilum, Strain UTEX LB 985" /LENGTH=58 /DNA_ID=CAMNT_0015961653 /DNA_START=700 /DNA_END=876 /DNA_ORIENTATION=+